MPLASPFCITGIREIHTNKKDTKQCISNIRVSPSYFFNCKFNRFFSHLTFNEH